MRIATQEMYSHDFKLKVLADLEAGMSGREAEKKHGVRRGTMNEWKKKHKEGKLTADPVADRINEEQAKARKEEYVKAVSELGFRQYLSKLVKDNVQPMPKRPAPPKRKAGKTSERYPLMVLSDWHFEEVVRSEATHGLNSYGIPASLRRAYRVIHALLDWKKDYEAAGRHRVSELTVAFLGDMLTGTLHGLERHSSAPNIVRACLWCGDLLAMVLADLAEKFQKVNVVGVVGNHGRLPDDKKVPTKDPTRSWDYMAYEIARRRLGNQKNIEWHLPESYGVAFPVGGHWCYACHGNFISNPLGVVGYGIRRFATSMAGNLAAAGKPVKYCFFGHWHGAHSSEFAGIESFICPSLIGTQEYSLLSGGSISKSAQQLFIFDKELGYVGGERLYGEGPGYSDGTYKLENAA